MFLPGSTNLFMRLAKKIILCFAPIFIYIHSFSQIDEKTVVLPAQPKTWQTFPLKNIRLTEGSPFYKAMQVSQQYLLGIDVERMLNRHRKAASLPEKGNYPGSNQPDDPRPGDLFHYLSGISLMYAQTGNDRFLERANYIVDELKSSWEKANPRQNQLQKMFAKILRGELELKAPDEFGYPWNGNVDAGNIWHGVHKEFAALRDAYLYTDNEKVFALLKKEAEPVTVFALQANPDLFDDMLDIEHGGMNEVFADLYALTGDKRYMDVSMKFNHQKVILNIANGKDVLYGRHANMQVPTFAGTARQY